MATNEFLTFATDVGANVETQASYSADAARTVGYSTGVAASGKLNKVWRQAAFMAAVLGQFIVDQLAADCLDDGDLAGKTTQLENAVIKLATPGPGTITDAMLASGVSGTGEIAKTTSPAFLGIMTAVNINATGTISDAKGDVRALPQNAQALAYTLVASDKGKHILASGDVTIPSGIFSTGDVITVVNNTAGNITIVQGTGVTAYQAGQAATGNRTLAQRGVASLVCIGVNIFIVCGAGIS